MGSPGRYDLPESLGGSMCGHELVQPVDEHWAKCLHCGDSTFPITVHSAGECDCEYGTCPAFGGAPVPVDPSVLAALDAARERGDIKTEEQRRRNVEFLHADLNAINGVLSRKGQDDALNRASMESRRSQAEAELAAMLLTCVQCHMPLVLDRHPTRPGFCGAHGEHVPWRTE